MNAPSDRPLSAMRILVADDEPDSADMLAMLLEAEFGCQTFVALDGVHALRIAVSEQPDVLVLDIHMPGLGGIDVARRLLQAAASGASARPLLIAMTGRAEIAEQLVAIDGSFDDAFAKPLDIDRFVARLTRHWHGEPARATSACFDLFDCFTRAAREVLPSMAAKHQTVSFDCSDECLEICDYEVGLRSAMYRLMAGLADVMGPGFVVLMAESREEDASRLVFSASVAGTGELVPAAGIEQVLARLALTIDKSNKIDKSDTIDKSGSGEPARHVSIARGVCPISGGRIVFVSAPGEGAMFRFELTCTPVSRSAPVAHAADARAWVIDADPPRAEVLSNRLKRFGWRVRRFATPAEAVARIAEHPARQPLLVLVHDGRAVSWAAAADLHRRLSPQSTLLLLAGAGSRLLSTPQNTPFTVRVEPLSPSDLGHLTERAVRLGSRDEAGPASTWSTLHRERPTVLVVDDNAVNRLVASGLVRSLGYDVVLASDGLDAIEHCKVSPPDVVLMDLNMSVLGGLDATRRLRELQRIGRVAPFPIVAATALDDAETAHECLVAGMDGFLGKPLRLNLVQDELRRVMRQDF